jgi:hypothetical protein
VKRIRVVFGLNKCSIFSLVVHQPHDGGADDQGIDVDVVFPILKEKRWKLNKMLLKLVIHKRDLPGKKHAGRS